MGRRKKSANVVKPQIANAKDISTTIFNDLYEASLVASKCPYCESIKFVPLKNDSKRFRCKECKKNFGAKTGTIFFNSRYTNARWTQLLEAMIKDLTAEQTSKKIDTSTAIAEMKWDKMFHAVDWDYYNVTVREKPSKNIYGTFELTF